MRRSLVGLLVAVIVIGIAGPALAQGSVGVVDTSTGQWFLRDPATGKTTQFFFGNPGDLPMVGDWDGDGDETPGLYRQSDGFVYLRNSNSQGVADVRFFFGNPGDIPLAGDFDGDGFDSVSIHRPTEGRVYVINELGAHEGGLGAADFAYFFGNPGDKPFVGDFDGDGDDEVGLHRESTGLVYFRFSTTQGPAESQFIFGDPGDKMMAADWDADGDESVGLFRPANTTMYLRHSNTQGVADQQFVYGMPTGLPVAGEFGVLVAEGPPPPPPPPAPFAPFTITGTGNAVIPLSVPGDVGAVVDLSHNGEANFIVWSLSATNGMIDLLVNEIGPYAGRRSLNMNQFPFVEETVRGLDITSDGDWSVTVRPLSHARAVGTSLDGHGDDFVRFTAASPTTMTSTHSGTSNFIIWANSSSGELLDLIVNWIGPYNATDLIPEGAAYLDITADGDWTLRVP